MSNKTNANGSFGLSTVPFGTLRDGTSVDLFTLRNRHGMELSVTTFGASVQSLKVPTSKGSLIDVVLGYASITDYENSFLQGAPPYFGAIIGRVAGRIANGKLNLHGKTHQLDQNHGAHHLHGGKDGFSHKVWSIISRFNGQNPSITLAYLSKSEDSGYPGDIHTEVCYTLYEDNRVSIVLKAKSSEDTVLNLTQHTYFNLNGHTHTLDGHELWIDAENIVEVDSELIPTGKILSLKDHEHDYSTPKGCPTSIDCSFVLIPNSFQQARLRSNKNGLRLSVETNQKILHTYIGGDTSIFGKDAHRYHQHSGICFETQAYPDALNHPNFPSIELRKGEDYRSETIFQFEF